MVPQKLLILITSHNIGGFETRLNRIVNTLNKQLFDIIVLIVVPYYKAKDRSGELRRTHKNYFSWDGVQTIEIIMKYRYDFTIIFRIAQLIKMLNLDSILFFSVGSGTFIAPLAAKLARIPTLIRISGTVIHRLYPAVLRCFDRLLLRMTDKILVPAEFLKKQYVHEFKINPEKVKVILNGVDLPERDATYYRSKARDELDLSQTSKVIGMVANFTENKGHYYLIKAIPQILKRFPHTYFLLIGEGPTRLKLEQLVSEWHIEAHVRFLGYQASVEKLISSCDVGVLCSMMEICNNSILEMMTLGIPVVATNVGGTPEIIRHDVNGLLVPPEDAVALGDAIITLLAHPSISKKLGQNGRAWVAEKYNRKDMVVAYQNEILNSDRIR